MTMPLSRLLPLCIVAVWLSGPAARASSGRAIIKDVVRDFGAKGDGRTNDQTAFEQAAAFFNARHGAGILVIPKRTYVVGRKDPANPVAGRNVLDLSADTGLTIEGNGATIKFADGLKFGSFDPATGAAFRPKGYFVDPKFRNSAGVVICLRGCRAISIKNLVLDGNSDNYDVGGAWGDTGYQVDADGIGIYDCSDVLVEHTRLHHFGRDGIMIGNRSDAYDAKIRLRQVVSEYNGRQGLSWIGGRGLTVSASKFNCTGRGKIVSAPGAGVDIESEEAPISRGTFDDCEFINNAGIGMVADSGPSSDVTFNNCLFWGTTDWSIWPKKPRFRFNSCKIFGSIVNVHNGTVKGDATVFSQCTFQDSSYNGKPPYGGFLIEINGPQYTLFDHCKLISRTKLLYWVDGGRDGKENTFDNCEFFLYPAPQHKPYPDYISRDGGVRWKNCTFHEPADSKGYWYDDCCEDNFRVEEGQNKHLRDLK